MGKIMTLEEYLAANEFLRETAEFHFRLEKTFAELSPLEMPPREKVLNLIRATKIPMLQHNAFRVMVLDSTEELLRTMPRELQEDLLRQKNSSVHKLCEDLELSETLARTIFWATIDRLIPAELKHWEREDWHENFCPICGRRPVMAWLKRFNEGRARYLLCGGCGTQWHWQRVGCPYCGNMNLEKIYILEVDDKQKIRLDVCKECNQYIKTYGEDGEEDIYLRDWTTLHLDLLAEERGLHKCGAVELE